MATSMAQQYSAVSMAGARFSKSRGITRKESSMPLQEERTGGFPEHRICLSTVWAISRAQPKAATEAAPVDVAWYLKLLLTARRECCTASREEPMGISPNRA